MKEGEKKKIVEVAGEEDKREESRRSPSWTDCWTIVEWQSDVECERRRMKCQEL